MTAKLRQVKTYNSIDSKQTYAAPQAAHHDKFDAINKFHLGCGCQG